MSVLKDNLHNLTQQLIKHLSGLKVDSEEFKCMEKTALRKLQQADTLFRPNRDEVDGLIRSLSDKFRFHGYSKQAIHLRRIYDILLSTNGNEDEVTRRLSVVKLLVYLSESPTNNFDELAREDVEICYKAEVIDWPKYLREGITRWTPPPDCDSNESDLDIEDERELVDVVDSEPSVNFNQLQFDKSETERILTYHDSKTNLENSVQSYWFSREKFSVKPPSDDYEANVTHRWDNFVEDLTRGLIPTNGSVVVSEYKMLREIIWQFYKPHESACFHFIGDKLVPKSNVAIASVRHAACVSLLHEFVEYVEWLQVLRDFGDSLPEECADTYRSYSVGLRTILEPIFVRLREIEDQVKGQESTFTMLSLAKCLRPPFETVRVLLRIHRSVVLDSLSNSPILCATTLLTRLYDGLLFASSKLSQDIYLTLYLHSLYKYLTVINNWLESDVLNDHRDEFVISDGNQRDSHVHSYSSSVAADQSATNRKVEQGLRFSVKDLNESVKFDPILKLISTHVLEFGKNFHLLRLLQQRHLCTEHVELCKDTFYEVFKQKVLEKVATYFNNELVKEELLVETEPNVDADLPTFIFPVGCPDECKYPTEMDKLENLVDTGDGFLIKAFEAYFVKRKKEAKVYERSLFERIQSLTEGLFPAQNIVPNAFIEILNERYSKLGVMVKNALVDDCELEKHFLFLQNIFLFKDDMIFSFYNYFFNILESNRSWSIQTSLTSHLQDTIADVYPKLYNKATVDLKENWQLSTDPVTICQKLNIHYQIEWPINIIIQDEHITMYSYMFQFILKVKWSLYTLNYLYFTELQLKKTKGTSKKLIKKLQILRFGLVNIFSNIQHYIQGHVFSELSLKFKRSFESAYGLENVTRAHTDFVRNFHKVCYEFQERERNGYGFYLLLHLVKKLKIMWSNMEKVNYGEVVLCEKTYWTCHSKMEPILNPSGFCT
ncbi:hypothetical protein RI129_013172 [Pyrocoelia pectoralis]|uniref:Gamma-tubulin complex component n=1 Tax=Pyrocoelia pectoralis TaxID=417401 RepID=A0AAN7UZY1_9COLE